MFLSCIKAHCSRVTIFCCLNAQHFSSSWALAKREGKCWAWRATKYCDTATMSQDTTEKHCLWNEEWQRKNTDNWISHIVLCHCSQFFVEIYMIDSKLIFYWLTVRLSSDHIDNLSFSKAGIFLILSHSRNNNAILDKEDLIANPYFVHSGKQKF